MKEKKIYEEPEMNVITFQAEDVIRTSGWNDDNETDTIPSVNSNDEINWYL